MRVVVNKVKTMTIKRMIIGFLAATALVVTGCAAEIIDDGYRPYTDAKVKAGKADQWNNRNNPDRFRVDLEYDLNALPKEGRSEHIPWPDTYWPTYKDGINDRWQGQGTLSPAEKYDVAFNNWDADAVDGLRPLNSSKCNPEEWDEEYYNSLGPAASYTSRNKGNKSTRDAAVAGKLKDNCNAKDDGDCIKACDDNESLSDSDRGYCKKRCNRGGVETWWGLCHAWVPAAMLEEEPQHAVEYDGVKFEVSDIKALLIEKYNRSHAYMIGGRCNEREVDRDDQGRISDEECRDTNAGSYHVVMANFLGLMKRSVAEDRTYNYEVWNQPIIEWKVNEMKELTEQEALTELGMGPDVTSYPYNDLAKKWFRVKATSHYITESHASTEAYTDSISTYTRQDHYDYILEVDEDGKINGGEWLGNSRTSHPDFLWLPTGAGGGNPDISLDKVRMLLEKSRGPVVDTSVPGAASDLLTFDNPFEFQIPDNDPNGVRSTIDVSDSVTVNTIKVEVDIQHTFIGDLKVVLIAGGHEVVLHDRSGGSADNIQRTFTVTEFAGINSAGSWELFVSDHANSDVGRIAKWKLSIGVGGADSALDAGTLNAASNGAVSIPDNDEDGAQSHIQVTENHSITGVKVHVKLTHTYIGSLVIELKNGAVTKVLHNEEGGSDTTIDKTYDVEEFNGANTEGRWTLIVRDTDGYDDEGTLDSWSLEFLY
jgi:subtilisin-like proprotein convertase family protein